MMKREMVEMSALEMQRYVRRIGAQLIRAKPVWTPDHKEGFVILYIEAR